MVRGGTQWSRGAARRKIRQVQAALRISEHTGDQAQRWYTLAVEHRFTKGRRSEIVVAVCLYVACRMSNTSHMLIDFSDMLQVSRASHLSTSHVALTNPYPQVNVFVLGMTYLRLVQTLNIKLPLVDPAHYIHRFAALLEFGDETGKVATDAVRLVQRFNRDWMTAGRRPAGICGACILLAARMNNFRRSVQEIVQVVKIADVTLKRRLEEFKKTASGSLTVADFRKVWLEDEMDPPAFTQAKAKEEKRLRVTVKRKRKRKRGEDGDESRGEDEHGGSKEEREHATPEPSPAVDPTLFNQGILTGTQDTTDDISTPPLFCADLDNDQAQGDKGGDDKDDSAIDPRLLNLPRPLPLQPAAPTSPLDETFNSFLTEEVSEFIENEQGSLLAEALQTAEQRQQSSMELVDELLGLDEAELDRMILSEEEVKLKERIWVELNREYLEKLAGEQCVYDVVVFIAFPERFAAKTISEQNGEGSSARPRKVRILSEAKNYPLIWCWQRRKAGSSNKPRDASNAHGATAAESVRNFVTKNKKFSRKINYSAYDTLFGGTAATDTGQAKGYDDGEDGLYTMDDKSDGEGMVVVEEEGGGVGALKTPVRRSASRRAHGDVDGDMMMDASAKADSDEDAEGEKDDDAWGVTDDVDAYEQEV